MKHLNKTIIATTLLTSLFLAQPVLAGEKATHGDFASHTATSLQSEITAPKMKHGHQEQATRSKTGIPERVNFMLMKDHDHEAYLNQQFFSGKR